MKKRLLVKILAIVLSIVLIVCAMPFTFVSAEDSNNVSLNTFKNPSGTVDTYSPDSKPNPYGYGKGQIFTMSTQDELFHLVTYDINSNDKNDVRYESMIFSKFNAGSFSGNFASAEMSKMYLSGDTSGGNVPYSSRANIEFPKSSVLYHMQALAFDPFNSGHNDHVAIVGANSEGKGILQIVDGKDKKIVATAELPAKHTALVGNSTEAFEAANFIAVTAGRYTAYNEDSPAGETLVIYYPDMNSGPKLYEYSVTRSSPSGSVTITNIETSDTYLQADYRVGHYGKLMQKETDINHALTVSLATGDFNGDRIDDLAVISSVSDPDYDDYKDISFQYFTPELYVAFGGGDSKTILDRKAKGADLNIWNEDKSEMVTMTSPSLAAGDADGDGVDDIIAGGWRLKLTQNGAGVATVKKHEVVSGVTFGVWTGLGNNLNKLVFKSLDSADAEGESGKIANHWSEKMMQSGDDKFNSRDSEYVMPQYAVEAVAINGDGAADYIFMNGTFCQFDKTDGLKQVFTPDYFRYGDRDVEGKSSNAQYISSAAVGVFDHNTVGREQITVSVGLKQEGFDDYYFMLGTMGGYDYGDKTDGNGAVKEYGYASKFYSTGFDRRAFNTNQYDYGEETDYAVFDRGNGSNEYLNCLVAAVDIGNDGVLARYIERKLIYSDPNIVAVLQAAPYFGELSDTAGSTTYTIGTEYTIGKQNSKSTSFSIGVSAELEGPGIKVAAGSGYTGTWAESFDKSFTESYSTTFTAGENNQVILQRTPIVVYCYEVQYAGTDWDNKIQVSIPHQPIYVQLNVEDYNAYVAEYNAGLRGRDGEPLPERLKPIDGNRINGASLIGNEGVPEKYIKAWTQVEGKNLSNATYGINANDTGSTSSEYSASDSETETTEKTDGLYVNASVGTGASFLVGSAYVGVDTSVESDWTVGKYTTTTKYSSASGTVVNLGGVSGVPAHIRSQYGFAWTFGKWTVWLDNENPGIPVYGFQVDSIERPVHGPRNLNAVDGTDEGTVDLSWDAISGAEGYIIYTIDMTGQRNEIGRVDSSSGTPASNFTYTYDSRTPFYIFAVSSFSGSTEGAMSEKAIYYPQSIGTNDKDGITPQLRINQNTNMWEVSYDGGVNWSSLGVAATGEKGADGKDGEDGRAGSDGADGTDGITPEFRINPDNNIWEVSYDDGVTWTSLEVIATGASGTDGRDGVNGVTPLLRINASTNMWEVSYDGGSTWDSLNIKATGERGTDGQDGQDGQAGADGQDGTDGITPQLRIDPITNMWEVSYDGGSTWTSLGVTATGEKGADGHDGDNGQNGKKGKNGKDGIDGKDGKDGIDGKDGLTPYIGNNGNWWIGTEDTGVRAAVNGNGTEDIDGDGIVSAKLNDKGELVITLADGSTFRAVGADGQASDNNTDSEDMETVKAIATVSIILSVITLVWNAIALAAALIKKK